MSSQWYTSVTSLNMNVLKVHSSLLQVIGPEQNVYKAYLFFFYTIFSQEVGI